LIFAYAVAPILTLLIAHYLFVMKLDLDAYMRAFSLVIPAIVGLILVWQAGRSLGTDAAGIALAMVAGSAVAHLINAARSAVRGR
jgi:hypothetical protein